MLRFRQLQTGCVLTRSNLIPGCALVPQGNGVAYLMRLHNVPATSLLWVSCSRARTARKLGETRLTMTAVLHHALSTANCLQPAKCALKLTLPQAVLPADVCGQVARAIVHVHSGNHATGSYRKDRVELHRATTAALALWLKS